MQALRNKLSSNPVLARIRADGIFASPSTGKEYEMEQSPTFAEQNRMSNAGIYEKGSFGYQNAQANVFSGGIPAPAPGAAPVPQMGWAGVGGPGSGPSVSPATDIFGTQINPSTVDSRERSGAWSPFGFAAPQGLYAPTGNGDTIDTVGFGGSQIRMGQDGTTLRQNPDTVPGAAGYVPSKKGEVVRPGSPNAGLIASLPAGTLMGDYVRAQESRRQPVDMAHLELLSKYQIEQDKLRGAKEVAGMKGEVNAGITAAGQLESSGDPVADAMAAKQAYMSSGKPTLAGLAKFDKDIAAAKQAAESEEKQSALYNESADLVISNIEKIVPVIDKWDSGVIAANMREAQKHVKGSEVYQVEEWKKPILANIATEKLQAMRDASKNGASGFGQLAIQELELLKASRGSLETAQNPAELKAALESIKGHFSAWKIAYEAGKKASSGSLSLEEQANAILAARAAAAAGKKKE